MTDKKSPARELLDYFRANNLDQYGSVIDSESVRGVLGIEVPEVATMATFQELSMQELSAVDYVRKVLLREGKYLAQTKGNYRILLPSENAAQVESYMTSADKKLKRALILSKNTPADAKTMQHADQVQARIIVKRESIKDKAPIRPTTPSQPPISQRMPDGVRIAV